MLRNFQQAKRDLAFSHQLETGRKFLTFLIIISLLVPITEADLTVVLTDTGAASGAGAPATGGMTLSAYPSSIESKQGTQTVLLYFTNAPSSYSDARFSFSTLEGVTAVFKMWGYTPSIEITQNKGGITGKLTISLTVKDTSTNSDVSATPATIEIKSAGGSPCESKGLKCCANGCDGATYTTDDYKCNENKNCCDTCLFGDAPIPTTCPDTSDTGCKGITLGKESTPSESCNLPGSTGKYYCQLTQRGGGRFGGGTQQFYCEKECLSAAPSTGYDKDTDGDGIPDSEDNCDNTRSSKRDEVCRQKNGCGALQYGCASDDSQDSALCTSLEGTCEDSCSSGRTEAPSNYGCPKLCCLPTGTSTTPTTMQDCNTPCTNPFGCDCSQLGTACASPPLTKVYPPNTCFGQPAASTENCIHNDGVCGYGCLFLIDSDCMSSKNAGYFIMDRFLNNYLAEWSAYQKFLERASLMADYIDPKSWMTSACNPRSELYYGNIDRDEAAGIFNERGETVAWFGAEKAGYNNSLFLYTMVWQVGNLDKITRYRILMKNEQTEIRVVPSSFEYYILNQGETHEGDDAAVSFYSRYNFEELCLDIDTCKENDFEACNETTASYDDKYPPSGGLDAGEDMYCRNIATQGEYDYGTVPEDSGGGNSTGGEGYGSPGDDGGVNCEITGDC